MDYNSLIAQYEDRQQSMLSAQDNMKMKFDDFISERDALKGARDQAGAMIGQGLVPVIDQATKLYTIAKQVKGVKALGGMLKDNETLGNIKDWFNRKMGVQQPAAAEQTAATPTGELPPPPPELLQQPTRPPGAGELPQGELPPPPPELPPPQGELPPPPAELLQQPTGEAPPELPPPPEEEAITPAIEPAIPDLPDLPGIGMPPAPTPSIFDGPPIVGFAQYRPRGTTLRRIQIPDQPQDEPIMRPTRPQLTEPTMSQFDEPAGRSSYTFGLFRSSRPARAMTTATGDDEFGAESRPSIQYFVPRAPAAAQEDTPVAPGFLSRIFGRRQVNLPEETPQIPDISDVTNLPVLQEGRAIVSSAAGRGRAIVSAAASQGEELLEQGTQAVQNTAQAGRNIGTAISGALSGEQPPSSAIRNITSAGQSVIDSLPDEWVSAIKSVLPDTAGEAIGTGLAVAGEIAGLTEGILQIKESFKQAADIDAEQTDLDQEASQLANHPIYSWGKQALDNYDTTQGQPVMSHF
jgi:hypothetical protein